MNFVRSGESMGVRGLQSESKTAQIFDLRLVSKAFCRVVHIRDTQRGPQGYLSMRCSG